MFSKLFKGGIVFGTIYLIIIFFGVVGWLMNLSHLFAGGETGGMEIARIIGIFVFPLGGILGYF